MKDIRCAIGWHAYAKRQIEDSQFLECRRCGKEKSAHVHQFPSGSGGA